jgi:hypothetical protein
MAENIHSLKVFSVLVQSHVDPYRLMFPNLECLNHCLEANVLNLYPDFSGPEAGEAKIPAAIRRLLHHWLKALDIGSFQALSSLAIYHMAF